MIWQPLARNRKKRPLRFFGNGAHAFARSLAEQAAAAGASDRARSVLWHGTGEVPARTWRLVGKRGTVTRSLD